MVAEMETVALVAIVFTPEEFFWGAGSDSHVKPPTVTVPVQYSR